jgi:hypothetical protein
MAPGHPCAISIAFNMQSAKAVSIVNDSRRAGEQRTTILGAWDTY